MPVCLQTVQASDIADLICKCVGQKVPRTKSPGTKSTWTKSPASKEMGGHARVLVDRCIQKGDNFISEKKK